MKFRKKPVVIDAIQWTGSLQSWVDLCNFCNWGHREFEGHEFITIPTLEGRMTASLNDWIIRGVKGEFYPCEPHIFEMTYELVEGK